ncbi:MAG: hypothetical protein JF619_24025, partial [Massilia sp.]|nr:hypothetical protein [Massilia sp.]
MFAAVLSLVGTPAAAGAVGFTDYHHTQWTVADGAPPGIRTMAQTRDGWLWLGTIDGLYRFDGLRFERYPLPAARVRTRDLIQALRAAPNGDLFIAYVAEGVSVLHPDGRFDDLPPQPSPFDNVSALAVDTDGSLWTLGARAMHLVGGRWQVVPAGPAWASVNIQSLVADGAGRLWAFDDGGAWRLDRTAGRFDRVTATPGLPLLAPDGRLWQLAADGTMRLVTATGAVRPAAFAAAESRAGGQFGADGTLWLPKCPQTVCRVPDAAQRTETRWPVRLANPEPVAEPTRMSGQEAITMLEDREGDIWVATENGLDRFRRNRFLTTGLPGNGARYSLATDGDRVLAADIETGTLWRLAPDTAPAVVPGPWISVIRNGLDGAVLLGGKRSVWRRRGADALEIPLPPGPDGKPRDHHLVGFLDDGKVLWTASPETALIGWRDGRWLPRAAFNLPPKIYQSATSGPAGNWFATGDGKLVHYLDDKLTTCSLDPIGMASTILPGDALFVSGAGGGAVLREGVLRPLRTREPGVLRNLSGMVVTPDGDRWLNGFAGLVHVRAADWRQAMRNPDLPLRYELFGALDGYPGRAAFENRWPGIV